ncbi:MAG TPA: hypothetical protein VID47_11125 [Actinomycetota bacterium]|jgi:hypothetical protein
MSGHRDLVKRILPDRFVDWWRRRRVRILEAAGGGTKVTPGMVARHSYAKTEPARAVVRQGVVKVTPKPFVTRRRRKRALKRYLKALSYELLERETQLDYIEGRVAARRDGFYERIVREVLERTEIIQQELDRRIEGVSARSGERMNAIEEQLFALRDGLNNLRRLQELELHDVGARARAEVPEVPAADPAADADPAGGEIDAVETDPPGPETGDGAAADASGNGHVPEQAPAASTTE